MKRFLIACLIVSFLILMFSVTDLKAQTTQNIWITVSCTGTLSILVVNPAVPGVTNWFVTNKPFSFLTNRDVATIVSNSGDIAGNLGFQWIV